MRRTIRWFCYSDDTETLTSEGWMGLDALKRRSDEGTLPLIAGFDWRDEKIVFERPRDDRVLVFDYDGEMYGFKGAGLDLLVTPNHRMPVRWQKEGPWQVVEARDIEGAPWVPLAAAKVGGVRQDTFTLPAVLRREQTTRDVNRWRSERAAVRHARIKALHAEGLTQDAIARQVGVTQPLVSLVLSGKVHTVPRRPKGQHAPLVLPMDAWLEYLGWFVAEGYKDGYVCQGAKNERLPAVRRAMDALGITYLEEHKRDGQIVFKPKDVSKQFGAWLREHVGEGAHNKRLPPFVFDLPREQQLHLLRGLMGGDGSPTDWEKAGRGNYYTASRGLADDVQRLVVEMGFRSRLSRRREHGYVVYFSSRSQRRLPEAAVVTDYHGEVYCFSMPCDGMVTRRNGVVATGLQTAYNDFMKARVDMAQAAAAFIMKRTGKGTPAQLAKLAAKSMSRQSDVQGDTSGMDPSPGMPGPRPASILTENESAVHENMRLDSGAGNAETDGQMIRSQISAATHFPQHYLGDAGSANLATATSMELPVLKHIEGRQEVWEGVFRWFIDRVIEKAVDDGKLDRWADEEELPEEAQPPNSFGAPDLGAPAGAPQLPPAPPGAPQLPAGPPRQMMQAHEDVPADEERTERDLSYEFSMPNPLKRAMVDLVTAVSNIAKTFDPNNTNQELSKILLAVCLGDGLEMEDPQGAVERIFPEGYQDPAILAAQQQQQMMGQQPPGFPGADGDQHQQGNPYGAPMQSPPPMQQAMDEARYRDLPEMLQLAQRGRATDLENLFNEEVSPAIDEVLTGMLHAGNGNGSK
jgi:hypothetical protein